MCLMKVKDEGEYAIPARTRTYKRTSRRYSSPPRYYTDAEYSRRISRQYEPAYADRRYDRYSSSRVVEERKPSPPVALPPPAEPPAPSVHTSPPPPASIPPAMPPPPPSTHHSHSKLDAMTSVSRQPSRAPSAHTGTRTHFVEVEHDADSGHSSSSSSSSTSSLDDLRSRTTHRTSHTRNTSHTNKSHRTSAASSHKPPASEYSLHEREKEIRRERAYSRPRDQYETYRYVNAPQPDDGYGLPPQRRSGSRRDYWR